MNFASENFLESLFTNSDNKPNYEESCRNLVKLHSLP